MRNLDQLTEQDIARCLEKPQAPLYDAPCPGNGQTCREAGVLVPFVRVGNTWHLLFMRRPHSEKDRHSGQVAFAGGKRDPQDTTLTATALREAHEEMGIFPQHVRVLGQLSLHHSFSRFRIAPVVGALPWPYALEPNPQEVARTFTIPLRWLAEPRHHEIRRRHVPGQPEPLPSVHFLEYDNEVLWGTTARITLSLLASLSIAL